ncbi:MAG: hypothetical protein ACI4AQ_04555 [Lachnospiraceae bacterium]
MKKSALLFMLLSKRQFKNVFFCILLVAIPVITYCCGRIEGFHEGPVNAIAIYNEDEGEIAGRIINDLSATQDDYRFVIYDSLSLMEADVLGDKVLCGYAFLPNFTERLFAGDTNKIITVICKENSLMAESVNEIVFSHFYKEYCEHAILKYTASNEKFTAHGDVSGPLTEKYRDYVDGDAIFKIEFEELSGEESLDGATQIQEENITFPLRGILSILMLLGMFLGVISYNSDREKGMFKTLRGGFGVQSRILYVLVPVFYIALMTLFSLYAGGVHEGLLKEIGALICYIILLTAVGAMMGLIIPDNRIIMGCMPVVLLASILICPVFVDLENYFDAVLWIRKFFLPHYYLKFFG